MPSTLDAETLIERLVGVSAARVERTPDDVVSRVHVLSDGEKPARTMVRDIQGLLEHQCGVVLDPDQIHVVELGNRLDDSYNRPRLLGFEWAWGRDGVRVACRLGAGDRQVEGRSESADLNLSAGEAAVGAINALTGGVLGLRVLEVQQLETGRGPVMVTLVEMGGGELLTGSSPKGGREVVEAVIRATLDAVNRQLVRRPFAG